MTKLYVCQWELSGFETTEDGEDFNTSNLHDFTTHNSLEEAISLTKNGSEAYSKFQGIEDKWEPIYCDTILEYENNELVGKYSNMDQWRHYPLMEHWANYWPHLTNYPLLCLIIFKYRFNIIKK